MLSRLDELQAKAAALEPDASTRAKWLEAAAEYADQWLESLPELAGYVPDDERAAAALEDLVSEEPSTIETSLAVLSDGVDRVGVNEPSPHFFGFIPGAGLYSGALGDYLAAVTNRYAGVAYGGPGAVRMEQRLVRWLADEVGYPKTAAGDLTSGGSIANLSAVVAARESAGLGAVEIPRAVVYGSSQTHHSVTKALRVAGLGECVRRPIALDEGYRIRSDELSAQVARDRAEGLRPWLIVASAGATDTGAVDPLEELADITEREDLWLHVDAAYGGAFALCEPGREVLRGIDRADSIVIDPHKGLFIPFGSGVVLVRDGHALRQGYVYDANYLQDVDRADLGELSPSEVSPEFTRPFRGLRLWLSLQLAGVAAFRAALEEKMLLARYFHAALAEISEIEVGPEPDLSVVTWKLTAVDGIDLEQVSQRIADAIQRDDLTYLSTTRLDGDFAFRLAILNPSTHREHVDRAVEVIVRETRAGLAGSSTAG